MIINIIENTIEKIGAVTYNTAELVHHDNHTAPGRVEIIKTEGACVE